jgi:hypothetical protein
MKITTATYGGTFSTGNYENQKLSLSAQLEEGDTPDQVIAALKEKVIQLAGPTAQEAWHRTRELERNLFQLRKKTEEAHQEWEKVSAFLSAQGIKADMPQFPELKLLLPTPQPDAEYHAIEEADEEEDEPDF